MFRFQHLVIWKRSAVLSGSLFEIVDALEQRKKFRWAEQLRAATLSITNNIAEGSGSFNKAEFAQFLNYARRSAFESANIVILLHNENHLSTPPEPVLSELEEICRMITSFRKTLI